MESILLHGVTLRVMQGDITKCETGAIVNAANTSLLGGGGVDGAIHRAGGPRILEECKEIRSRQGGCPTGQAVYTSGGNLKSKFVIHTVGPVWQNGQKNEPELLGQCYANSLQLAHELQCERVAFPNISTGVYGYPKEAAADIAWSQVVDFVSQQDGFREIIFVCFDEENYLLYLSHLEKVKKLL